MDAIFHLYPIGVKKVTHQFEKPSFALTSFLRFAYESCFLFAFHIRQKVTLVSWKNPGSWEESILFWILLHHSRNSNLKSALSNNSYLVRFRLNKSFLHISDMPGKWFIR